MSMFILKTTITVYLQQVALQVVPY